MRWYIHVLKNYFGFSGRARRKEYWYFMLFYGLSLALGVVIDLLTGTFDDSVGLGWVSGAYFVATLPPALAVSVRRLHDIGRSGCWLLLELLPLVGGAVLMVLAIFNGQPGPNAFGPDPKEGKATRQPVNMPGPSTGWDGPPGIKTVRVLVFLALVAVVVACTGWYWSQTHREMATQARQHGAHSGRQLDERGCLETSMSRIRATRRNEFDTSIVEGAWLGSCLQASRVVPSFCDGVPTSSEVLPTVAWITSECTRLGLVGQACSGLLGQVVSYCTDGHRTVGEHIRYSLEPTRAKSQGSQCRAVPRLSPVRWHAGGAETRAHATNQRQELAGTGWIHRSAAG
jgi:uncharacterized membrane protein YhaH (DUF805 family)